MQAKILEIRDRMTFIPALCVDMNPTTDSFGDPISAHRYLLLRCGYPCDGSPVVLITKLAGEGSASSDPHFWTDRTFHTAHLYIVEHWSELKDGDVVDVEFILGETGAPKRSEREEHPL